MAFITTHFINEHIINEWEKLNATPGIDAFLLIDNTKKRISNPSNLQYGELHVYGKKPKVMLFDYDFHCSLHLPLQMRRIGKECKDETMFPRFTWYRGDFRFNYARHIFPDYDYYWQIENDCYFNTHGNNDAPFFEIWNDREEDVLGYAIRNVMEGDDNSWGFLGKGLKWLYGDRGIWKIYYPIVRLSGRTIDMLEKDAVEVEKEFLALNNKKISWPHCEEWTLSQAVKHGMTFAKINEHPSYVKFKPIIRDQKEIDIVGQFEKWHHPFKTKADPDLQEIVLYETTIERKEPFARGVSLEDFM